jgi:hypothetical protein
MRKGHLSEVSVYGDFESALATDYTLHYESGELAPRRID